MITPLSVYDWRLDALLFKISIMSHSHSDTRYPKGSIAVIFCAQLSGKDKAGYAMAADTMAKLASKQPGYLDMVNARNPDGFGITVSYWTNETAAKNWRDNEQHRIIRDKGRALWYNSYTLTVTDVIRGYHWP